MKRPYLSVIVPSRERADVLKFSLDSLGLERNNIEVLVWVDDDDPQLEKYHEIFDNNRHVKLFTKSRIGYAQFHIMQSFLVSQASGQWLFLWNDDAYMEKVDWYDKFVEYASLSKPLQEPVVYNIWGQGSIHNVFPILSIKFFQILGHTSAHCVADLYIKKIAGATHIHRNIFGIKPLHRKGGGDNNKLGDLIDNTYQYIKDLGDSNPDHHWGAYTRKTRKERTRDNSKIIEFLRNNKDRSARIGFVGLGKLGLPVALAIELRGLNIVAYDKDPNVRQNIMDRKNPPEDRALHFLWQDINRLFSNSTIEMVDSVDQVLEKCNIIFCAVGTQDKDYSDLKKVISEMNEASNNVREGTLVVVISPCKPGTYENHIKALLTANVEYVYNPLFLTNGKRIKQFLYPNNVIIGANNKSNITPLINLYKMILGEKKTTISDINSAEMAHG